MTGLPDTNPMSVSISAPSPEFPTVPAAALVIELTSWADAREAFFNNDLSRSFDRRSFAEGNIREGVVSTSHGALHRSRRRLENAQFLAHVLQADETQIFPGIIAAVLDALVDREQVDLYRLTEQLAVVLAARRIGLDVDARSREQVERLEQQVDGLVQMSAIVDALDPEQSRRIALRALDEWKRDFVEPARRRRAEALALREAEPSDDLLTTLLAHQTDVELKLDDDCIVRELATYMTGASQACAVATVNTIDMLLDYAVDHPDVFPRGVDDLAFVQSCVHESLRLRPNTPRPKRRAEVATRVGTSEIPAGATVIINVARANVDPDVFGKAPEAFDPHRLVPDGVPRWGLSFGLGAHQCPGRTLAAGFPDTDDRQRMHLFGLVALVVQEFLKRGVRRDPERGAVRESRTERFNAWLRYPAILPKRP